jgi:hypothetical protein
MSDPIRLDLPGYPCPCPGTPHTLEWVDLEPEPTLAMGAAFNYRIAKMPYRPTELDAETQARGEVAPFLVQYGIRAWSFTDEKGGRVKVHPDSIAALLPFGGPGAPGFEVTDKCMNLYLEAVSRPLRERWNRLLELGRKAGLTSPTPPSGESPPKPFEPSSRKRTAGKLSEVRAL